VSRAVPFVAEEIASQPACWERAAEFAGTAAVRSALPAPGERVAVVGCGTSQYMAQAFARLREDSGGGETDWFPASEFPFARRYDRVVAITRSGTTTEVVDLLARRADAVSSTVITTAAALPAAAHAVPVVLDFADERSVVQTRFATSALALWRAFLGADLRAVIADGAAHCAAALPADWLDRTHFTFLGTGWTVGLAHEAALKLREAAQAWTESYPAMEVRHGPISVLDERSVAWVFGVPPAGLVDELAASGAQVVADREADPMAALIGAQRLAVALAERRGLDPDRPRGLARSIVLAGRG
jgi:fructoselysine-6-P-deglycase FrlB-like protein